MPSQSGTAAPQSQNEQYEAIKPKLKKYLDVSEL
jgi:hypothetical protein